uniref:bone morphogenetic protein 1-like n=1 Tax=Ciona intestinalis TaxID=7719 RepID=UPI000EF50147|nr:bone morphogenetic protein 1-like [Ciona intestinalis]|eukprot:XP_026694478.1 bone morphogenetic protein 1-like [Ciona intestinalis]
MLYLSGGAGYNSPYYTSPNLPSNTSHNLDCYYKINARSRLNFIRVSFDSFHLEQNSRCGYDHIAIYEGSTTSSRLIGKYCGIKPPFTVMGRGQYMYMHYHTDSTVASTGFRFRFRIAVSRTQSCEQPSLRGPFGHISSPNFPYRYPAYADCRYTLTSSGRTRRIYLWFQTFDLGSNCNDYLDIRTGLLGNWSPTSKRYCGSTRPRTLQVITDQHLFIHFVSAGRGTGFLMYYSGSGQTCDQFNIRGAPGSNGLIQSPNFPDEYPQNIDCHYRIGSLSYRNHITVTFLALNIEYHDSCRYDYLDLYNGNVASLPTIRKFCGTTIPQPINYTTAYMSLRFKTDSSVARSGFSIRYNITGLYYPTHGWIRSPGYYKYPNNAENNFVIQPPGATAINLVFSYFNLEGSEPSCRHDSLVIRRGNETGIMLNKFCGYKLRFSRRYFVTKITLMFKTDHSVVRGGFSCFYSRILSS